MQIIFVQDNRELFTKICENSNSTSLVNDLCKLNIKNWKSYNFDNLLKVDGNYSSLNIDTAIASLTNRNNGHIKLVSAKELQIWN